MRRRFQYLALCVAALVLAGAAKEQTQREWKTGTLVDVQTDRASRIVGSTHSVSTRRDDRMYYIIDDGGMVWELYRTMTSPGDKPLRVTVNSPVQFAIEGDDAYLKDEDGKEHRLTVNKKTAKPPKQ